MKELEEKSSVSQSEAEDFKIKRPVKKKTYPGYDQDFSTSDSDGSDVPNLKLKKTINSLSKANKEKNYNISDTQNSKILNLSGTLNSCRELTLDTGNSFLSGRNKENRSHLTDNQHSQMQIPSTPYPFFPAPMTELMTPNRTSRVNSASGTICNCCKKNEGRYKYSSI